MLDQGQSVPPAAGPDLDAVSAMKTPPPRRKRSRSGFRAWLASNPSGVPRRHAFRRALIGVGLGITSGLLMSAFGAARTIPAHVPWLELVLGSIAGAVFGPLGVFLVSRLLDLSVPGDDHLVGYSGLIRMLLHAGELSFLGALAGGIGGGVGATISGLASGALVTSLVAGLLYRVRGLGMVLGIILGVIIGAIGGAVGGSLHHLGM